MHIRERDKKVKRIGGRDTFSVRVVYTPGDVKKCLQRHLRELIRFGFPNRFYETELVEMLIEKLFSIYDAKNANDMAIWGFDVALRKEYITTNRWDKDTLTRYFINPAILEVRPGPKGPRTERGEKELARKLKKEEENEAE